MDNDCDGVVPNGETVGEIDDDGDGFTECENDCDDDAPAINPAASESCNGIDDDCDGVVPADEANSDGDGFRVCDGDCDDNDAAVFPGNPELCDGLDNDCDGVVPADEADGDGDGFRICEGDCDDADPTAYSGAPELCGDGIDHDGDPLTDEEADVDGDLYLACLGQDCDDGDPAIHPGFEETLDDFCDGVDNNCDDIVDYLFDFDSADPDFPVGCTGAGCPYLVPAQEALRVDEVCVREVDDDRVLLSVTPPTPLSGSAAHLLWEGPVDPESDQLIAPNNAGALFMYPTWPETPQHLCVEWEVLMEPRPRLDAACIAGHFGDGYTLAFFDDDPPHSNACPNASGQPGGGLGAAENSPYNSPGNGLVVDFDTYDDTFTGHDPSGSSVPHIHLSTTGPAASTNNFDFVHEFSGPSGPASVLVDECGQWHGARVGVTDPDSSGSHTFAVDLWDAADNFMPLGTYEDVTMQSGLRLAFTTATGAKEIDVYLDNIAIQCRPCGAP